MPSMLKEIYIYIHSRSCAFLENTSLIVPSLQSFHSCQTRPGRRHSFVALVLASGLVCGAVFRFYTTARVLDLSVLKMELKLFDSDLDTRPGHDSLTSCKPTYTGKGRTEPKLLWLPYFPMLLIYFWKILLPEISYLLCDATSRQFLIDQMTICALYTTDMIIIHKFF